MSISIADFKAKAAERRAAELNPVAEVTLDGLTFRGRRVPLHIWLRAGRVPQFFAGLLNRDEAADVDADELASQLSPSEVLAFAQFQADVVCHAIAEPRVVTGDAIPAEDEIHLSDLPDSFVNAVVNWALGMSPDVPIATETGEVSVNALSNFPDDAERAESSGSAGSDGGTVRRKAKRASGNS
ncbi:hypothetical protein [Bacteriophage sp.]|nr:hypothetical protein [Bacteriophage sp.]